MDALANVERVLVKQEKELLESVTGFEKKNQYVLTDDMAQPLGQALEVGGSFLGRQFLRAARPFRMEITGLGANTIELRRPFRFFFHEVNIFDGQGQLLGTVNRRWSWIRRIYTISDANGQELFELFGPVLKPWTFEIRRQGEPIGAIRKKWSGLLKEAFTVADNFGLEFPRDLPVDQKAVLLGAVFLIDFAHFEQSGDGNA
jgi:uncharacterized protein YxjI